MHARRVATAVQAFRAGKAVILQDDQDRENEADLIIPAERITEPLMAMLIRECSGIVCLCLEAERARHLQLPPMVQDNQCQHGTAFTVSIEARRGVTTGVSAHDRVATIRAAVHPDAHAGDLARPGHVFPLQAHPQGLRGRRGHTEGSVELTRMAGFRPAAVLCELMNEDGTMMRGETLERFAAQHEFPILSVEDLVRCLPPPLDRPV